MKIPEEGEEEDKSGKQIAFFFIHLPRLIPDSLPTVMKGKEEEGRIHHFLSNQTH